MKSENQTSDNKYQSDYFKLVHYRYIILYYYRYITFITLPGAPEHCANCTSDSYGTSAEGGGVSIDSLRVGRNFLKKEKSGWVELRRRILGNSWFKKGFLSLFCAKFFKTYATFPCNFRIFTQTLHGSELVFYMK